MEGDTRHHAETDDGSGTGDRSNKRGTVTADHPDATHRSGLPAISVDAPTSSPPKGTESDDGYFSLKAPERDPTPVLSTSPSHSVTSIHSIASSHTSSHHEPLWDITRRQTANVETPGRPSVQRDISHASTASTASTDTTVTVTASNSGHYQKARVQQRPVYPNQAFAALHQQRYPPPHIPPPLRTQSLHPVSHASYSAAIAGLHQAGTRTVGSSPAATPGLFSPTSPPIPSEYNFDERGFYSSPFLHYTHRQAPKETHVADVDVDPISGRKIINEYEIIDELGRGTHGKVKLGRNLNTHEYVAIKIVERYSKKRRLGKLVGDAEDKVKKEVAILKKARHPNIVALLEVIDDPARKKVYIVLERVELGEIVWRTPGPKEIAMIEARRYERESKGIFQDPEADYEDDAILEEARMRRARKQRRLIRQLRRTRRRYHENQPWSIEFGGDTDSEAESDMENASRTSTTTTDTSSAEAVAELERALSRVAASHYGQAESGDATTPIPNEPPTEADLRRAEELARLDLQGTMYGPYGEQSDPSRAPSLASSVHSFHADDFAQRFGSGPHSAVGSDLLDEDIHLDLLYVPCMSIAAARVAFRDTVLGLQYLHYQGIIHRDIKPPNLLQTADHRIKISDFGVSYLGRPAVDEQAENLSESDAQDFDEAKELARTVGTAAFYAPELCYTNPDIEAPPVGKPIDVWALGITLFCMLFGRTPFVDSEFIVMRRIAEEEIYIPRKRLRPVDPKPKSRPTSHGRHFSPAAAGRRDQYELSYEEVDDVLYDLLARLLTKDPNKRITLEEVRHHPWIVQDVANKAQWLEESDPTRQTQGKKIEVSKEDLSEAVVPVIIGRVRDGIRKIGGALLGRNVSTRKRTPSNAGSSMSGSLFPGSGSGSSVGEGREREGRRSSLRGDESIFAALKSSRESEHPLAQSVTYRVWKRAPPVATVARDLQHWSPRALPRTKWAASL
ncbi:hypothetical protein M8818_002942 [Zalaria obscura]|uniref:Uncharacterized protein n=1 Tax=Zalaria obscura TaxID=2024903 RepID=A0ACC3SFH9_9PEZI